MSHNVGQVLGHFEGVLASVEIPSARLDVLILLEDLLQRERSWLLSHAEAPLTDYQYKKLTKQVKRRCAHEPLAHIRGFSEFYGRKFKINRHVLEPRPESETMIELLKALDLPKNPKVADVGTGSGAIGITAALENSASKVDLYDIDSSALAVAKHNTHMHELNLEVHKRDLLNRPIDQYDVVLANLPYVPEGWKINKPAMQEPRIAIFGGKDGLSIYRRLFEQLEKGGSKPQYILTEALPPQHEQLAQIAAKSGYKLVKHEDFIQVFTPHD